MPDSLDRAAELEDALRLVVEQARAYLDGIEGDHVQPPGSWEQAGRLDGPLPDEGVGALEALGPLAEHGRAGATRSSGARFFHFVVGGTTPAALAADWLTSAFDQNTGGWILSPFATELEVTAVNWLKELFRLPEQWAGILVTGGTAANYTALAAAREWCGRQLGVSFGETGLAGQPPIRVLTSGHVHASAVKSLSLLGIGRDNISKLTADATGRLDLEALERELASLGGAPAIVIANAGEVNAGDFDPIADMADLAERHGAWLHVDGAFGLFARVTPRTADLVEGVERAMSVSADGHKWLNVPHDCGFTFVRDQGLLKAAFGEAADYLPGVDEPRPNFGYMGPEGSRRARALAVWATLRAYGRDGYRAMVERHLDLAQHLARLIDDSGEFERLADVPLNIVCFRWTPEGAAEAELDGLNRQLGEALIDDGRVFAGTTLYEGKVAFRPAIVNWRSTERDIELLFEVLRELAARIRGS